MTSPDPTASTPSSPTPSRQRRAKIVVWVLLGLVAATTVVTAVTMTLTTPHCPVAESMPGEVELRVGAVPGVGDAEVNLVWDPPWSPQNMSDEARLELGFM